MAQEDYDQGYDDGRKSRDAEVIYLQGLLEYARADLKSERENSAYYRKVMLRPTVGDEQLPF